MPVNSPKKIKSSDFYSVTARCLVTVISPAIKAALGPRHPHLSRVIGIVSSAPKIGDFLHGIDALIQHNPTLSDGDRALLSAMTIDLVHESLVSCIARSLSGSHSETATIAFDDAIFESTRLQIETKINELHAAREQRALARAQATRARVQDDRDRKLRRLDGVAELLELSPSDSACVAVTLVHGQLILAANNSGRKENSELALVLQQKMQVLRDFLVEKSQVDIEGIDSFSSEEAYHDRNLARLATDDELSAVVNQLQGISPSALSPMVLKQALIKLMKTMMLDEGPFSFEEKAIFLNAAHAYTVLLPKRTPDGFLGRSVHFHMETFSIVHGECPARISSDHLGEFPAHLLTRNIHAEQLMLSSLKKGDCTAFTQANPLQIGVSKLCCVDCYDVLRCNPQFRIRGTSGESFPGTIQIETKRYREAFGTPVFSSRSCATDPSPMKTPGDPPAKRARMVLPPPVLNHATAAILATAVEFGV